LLVPYHCVRSTSPVVKKYREAVKTRILDETMGKSPDTYSKSVIPKRCIPANLFLAQPMYRAVKDLLILSEIDVDYKAPQTIDT